MTLVLKEDWPRLIGAAVIGAILPGVTQSLSVIVIAIFLEGDMAALASLAVAMLTGATIGFIFRLSWYLAAAAAGYLVLAVISLALQASPDEPYAWLGVLIMVVIMMTGFGLGGLLSKLRKPEFDEEEA